MLPLHVASAKLRAGASKKLIDTIVAANNILDNFFMIDSSFLVIK